MHFLKFHPHSKRFQKPKSKFKIAPKLFGMGSTLGTLIGIPVHKKSNPIIIENAIGYGDWS